MNCPLGSTVGKGLRVPKGGERKDGKDENSTLGRTQRTFKKECEDRRVLEVSLKRMESMSGRIKRIICAF